MARTFTDAFTDALFAEHTDACPLILLKMSGGGLASTLYFVNNTEDITSGGDTYTAFPFLVDIPPAESADRLPTATLTIDNVSTDIIEEVRELTSSPTVSLAIIEADSPNTVEAGWWDFTLYNVSYDKNVITGSLGFEKIMAEYFPQGRFDADRFPALY